MSEEKKRPRARVNQKWCCLCWASFYKIVAICTLKTGFKKWHTVYDNSIVVRTNLAACKYFRIVLLELFIDTHYTNVRAAQSSTIMATLLRYGHTLNAPLTNIRRHMVQFNQIKCTLPLCKSEPADEYRYYHQQHHNNRNNSSNAFSLGAIGFISVGCVSIAVYNWKR